MIKNLLYLGVFFLSYSSLFSQITNPIPEPIEPSGLVFKLEEYVSIQISSGQQPRARINMLREVPDGSGRQFVNDLRGKFWVIDGAETILYSNPLIEFANFFHTSGKGSGFGAFAFHPEFATNGKLYTTHSTTSGSAPADFSPALDNGIALQWVLTEWTADDPSASVFEGTRREMLRLDFPYVLHGIQDIQFNPNAVPGDEDYGLLYVCVGDGGSSLNFLPQNIQTPASYLGTILRIDPLGSNSANGQYGIPESNPFTNDPNAMGEVWTYGFRNPHRICWDTEGDHKMLIGDIGEKNIEELNLGMAGTNYGWGRREGTFLYDRIEGQDNVFELPSDDDQFDYVYPVAQYDHDEGLAIVGGYVYRGTALPELYGKYLFGDIPSGRVFVVNADELELGSQAEIQELLFVDAQDNQVTLLELVNGDRADLRFGIDGDGEIYILTKADGKIRTMKSPSSTAVNEIKLNAVRWLSPNPSDGLFQLETDRTGIQHTDMIVVDVQGKIMWRKAFEVLPKSVDLSTLPAGNYWVRWKSGDQLFTQHIQKM